MAVPTNLHRDLGRIEGKLDAVLSETRAQLRDHEARIKVLEAVSREEQGAAQERKRLAAFGKWLWGAIMAALGLLGGILGAKL